MSNQKWFTLRGEQYQYDQGQWWRKLKVGELVSDDSHCKSVDQDGIAWWPTTMPGSRVPSQPRCDYRVPCSQPFQVGDRVKVVRVDGRHRYGEECVIDDVQSNSCLVFGDWIPCHWVEPAEPAEPSPAYIQPAGWRVKGDDEVVEAGDSYSHDFHGKLWLVPNDMASNEKHGSLGRTVSVALATASPNGGYILTPIVEPATQTPDVSLESQNDDGWEIYEPVVGKLYSPGTQYIHKRATSNQWFIQPPKRHTDDEFDAKFIYRRPKQKPVEPTLDLCDLGAEFYDMADSEPGGIMACSPAIYAEMTRKPHLDIYLPEVERKVMLASKDRPELLDWWRAEKERLAIEAGKRMGGGM